MSAGGQNKPGTADGVARRSWKKDYCDRLRPWMVLIPALLGSVFRIRVSSRRREKRVGGLVRGEPCFEALAQGVPVFALGVQEDCSLVSRFFQRQSKQGLFAGRVHGCCLSFTTLASAASIS